MKYLVLSVYDSKIKQYGSPAVTLNRGAALRSWETQCNDNNSDPGKYPADFTLFEIGEWDADTGTFAALPAKISLGTAIEFIRGNPRQSIPVEPTDLNPNIKGMI